MGSTMSRRSAHSQHQSRNEPDNAQAAARNLQRSSIAQTGDLLRALVDHLPEKIGLIDQNGRHLLANPAYLRWVGALTEQEVLGHTLTEVFSEEQAARYGEAIAQVRKSGEPLLSQEERLTSHLGYPHWISVSYVPWHDAQEHIVGV